MAQNNDAMFNNYAFHQSNGRTVWPTCRIGEDVVIDGYVQGGILSYRILHGQVLVSPRTGLNQVPLNAVPAITLQSGPVNGHFRLFSGFVPLKPGQYLVLEYNFISNSRQFQGERVLGRLVSEPLRELAPDGWQHR